MFKDLTDIEKEERFNGLINYAEKINNNSLKIICIRILNDYKEELFSRVLDMTG